MSETRLLKTTILLLLKSYIERVFTHHARGSEIHGQVVWGVWIGYRRFMQAKNDWVCGLGATVSLGLSRTRHEGWAKHATIETLYHFDL